jgi:hypothetical protein
MKHQQTSWSSERSEERQAFVFLVFLVVKKHLVLNKVKNEVENGSAKSSPHPNRIKAR